MIEKGAEAKHDGVDGGVEEALARIDPGQVVESVATFTRENPHAALAAAAGIGFLLGGGLTPRLLGAIGLFAARQYLRGMLRETLRDVTGEGGPSEGQSPVPS
ncbi:MAG: hypothetical protein IT372_11825 [Polyangiaceae bacterium]|nr:hypothetical protein [Polyangiaceae bacterium]